MVREGLTTSGVAYDLAISPHKVKVNYTGNMYVVYVFSSELYKRKFEERQIDNREKINMSLSNRFGFEIENNLLCDIKLYSMIEKRGFLLLKNNKEEFKWLDVLKLDGKNLIQMN